jgi:hypothetical protein
MSQAWQIDNLGKCCPCRKDDDDILKKNTNSSQGGLNNVEVTDALITFRGSGYRNKTIPTTFRDDIKNLSMANSAFDMKDLDITDIYNILSNMNITLDISTKKQLNKMIKNIGKAKKTYTFKIDNTNLIYKKQNTNLLDEKQNTNLLDDKQNLPLATQNKKPLIQDFIELSAGKDENHINIKIISMKKPEGI